MPVPTPPPAAANHANPQPNVAAAQRAPENNRREVRGNREQANHQAPPDNAVAASQPGNGNAAPQNGNGNGNGRGNGRHGG